MANLHSVDSYVVHGQSLHTVDSYVVHGQSLHSVDSYEVHGQSLRTVDSETAHDHSHLSIEGDQRVHVRPVQRELDTIRSAEKQETVPETINLEYLYPSRPCLCFHPQSFPFFSFTRGRGERAGWGWGVGGRGVGGRGVGGWRVGERLQNQLRSLIGFLCWVLRQENI